MEQKLNNANGATIIPHHDKPSERRRRYPVALSVAGSDSSGGAGIQADLKTFSALGVYGATAITAITAQNTRGVVAQQHLTPDIVYRQIVAVIDDISPSVVKIGMLANAEIAEAVADALGRYSLPIILDPVMVSSSGHRLLSKEAEEVIKRRLLPLSTLVTPNIPEMEALCGIAMSSIEAKSETAQHLISLGAKAILLKGGHEEGDSKTDILYQRTTEGIATSLYTSSTTPTSNIHGTGCTLSSAIAAFMARGLDMESAVGKAKAYISRAIESGADIAIGHGFGPVNHLFDPQKMMIYEE